MNQTPPTVTLSGLTAERRRRTGFYTTVGCLSVIVGLLLGVVGFFGVRALQGGGEGPVVEETATDEATTEEPAVLEATPVGEDSAVPFGSTFPFEVPDMNGEVEVTFSDLDWDGTEEVLAENSFSKEPAEGSKYVLLRIDGVYEGTGFDTYGAIGWAEMTYVAEDGTEYADVSIATPGYDEQLRSAGVAEDGSFFQVFCFEVPTDLQGGGHFVMTQLLAEVRAGAWVEAP